MGTEKSLIDVYTIPQAPDSFNSGALISQSPKFSPESDDVRIHCPHFDGYLRSPDTIQEILAIQNSAVATEQLLQQSKFNACEKNRMHFKTYVKGLWIQHKLPHKHPGG